MSALMIEGALDFMADLLAGEGWGALAALSAELSLVLLNILSGSQEAFGVKCLTIVPDFKVQVRTGAPAG